MANLLTTRTLLSARIGDWRVALEFKVADLWIGVYFKRFDIWICLVPCLPIHIKLCDACERAIGAER